MAAAALRPPPPAAGLTRFQRDVLVRPGIGERRDQAEPGFSDARAVAVDEGELPDRRINRLLVKELLDLVEDCSAPLLIQFGCLLLEKFIDIRVAAVGIGASLDDVGLQTS